MRITVEDVYGGEVQVSETYEVDIIEPEDTVNTLKSVISYFVANEASDFEDDFLINLWHSEVQTIEDVRRICNQYELVFDM